MGYDGVAFPVQLCASFRPLKRTRITLYLKAFTRSIMYVVEGTMFLLDNCLQAMKE